MKKTITENDVVLRNLLLEINGEWIFPHMIGDNIKIKSQIINAATDKVGFDKVKECIVDDFERFTDNYLYDMLNHMRNNEKKVSEYMNVSRGVFDIFSRKSFSLSLEFVDKSKQLGRLKRKMINDIRKCRTKDQMLEMFQKDLQTPMIMVFLRYCFLEENLVTA